MSHHHRVLIVDDDPAMREMVVSLLGDLGFDAVGQKGAEEAIAYVAEHEVDAVVSDIRMPGKTGLELVGEIHARRPGTPVILMTAFGSIDSAVEAMRAGAFDYVTKPFKRDELLLALERAFETRALEEENRQLRRAVDRSTAFGDLIGASPAMHEIFALVRKVADNRSSVLITGESGTGKEVVARTLHFAGRRKDRPFIPINCTAIPEGLLESELFGHVRGAFTGAHTTKRGLFEEANGGTLFLDEIGDMGPGLQSKLLRVLQDREIRPVGGNQTVKVDVRIVAATNKDLEQEMEAGRFRRDLFYRLNVIPIHIPPLRERPEDIRPLAEALMLRHAGDETPRRLSEGAIERLMACPWEGNARELENVLERALALASGDVLDADDLPLGNAPSGSDADDGSALLRTAVARRWTLHELGDRYIEAILAQTGGNKVRAAKILGINRRTLYRRGERARERAAASASDEC
jgi:two-component system response regulator PilR (NtrC family)/two-component system response regulator HydG